MGLFSWADALEFRWVGRKNPDYPTTAQSSFVGSLVALGVSIALGFMYEHGHEPGSGGDAMWSTLPILEALVFVWAVVRGKPIWSRPGIAVRWFLCHGLVIFVGGLLSFVIAMHLVVLIGMFIAGAFIWWIGQKILFSPEKHQEPEPPHLGPGEVLVEDGLSKKKLTQSMLSGTWHDEHGTEYERIPWSDEFVEKK